VHTALVFCRYNVSVTEVRRPAGYTPPNDWLQTDPVAVQGKPRWVSGATLHLSFADVRFIAYNKNPDDYAKVRFSTTFHTIPSLPHLLLPRFMLGTAAGATYSCTYLVWAGGLQTTPRPLGINTEEAVSKGWVTTYTNASTDPAHYRGKAVLILGRGNAAFEFANSLLEVGADKACAFTQCCACTTSDTYASPTDLTLSLSLSLLVAIVCPSLRFLWFGLRYTLCGDFDDARPFPPRPLLLLGCRLRRMCICLDGLLQGSAWRGRRTTLATCAQCTTTCWRRTS
jgi:hypothetical protein